jgi:pimeloyl-ACP methyl ester carboxylesterase
MMRNTVKSSQIINLVALVALFPLIAHDVIAQSSASKVNTPVSIESKASLSTCRVPQFAQEVKCGKIKRPLNPAEPTGVQIELHYVLVPSQDKNKLDDAVFLLAGGPGQSATELAGFGRSIFANLNRRRDLVFLDQRGTGKSAALKCAALENLDTAVTMAQSLEQLKLCRAQLQKLPYGQLEFFSTSIAVQDIEAVRQALHYGAINLVGASYGTRVGLEYLRQYPQSVRRLVLDGVVPPSMSLTAMDAQAALDGVFQQCESDTHCRSEYPNLKTTWQNLLASFNDTTIKVSILHPRLGHEVNVPMDKDTLLLTVHKTLYTPSNTAALPYVISQAAQGKYAPLMTLANSLALPAPGGITYGMYFSVWCGESMARPSDVKLTDDFVKFNHKMNQQVCEHWPRATIPAGFFEVKASPVPVLLLSGGIDPVTPKRHGAAIAAQLGSKARHLVIENAGHGLLSHTCVSNVVNDFIRAKDQLEASKVDAKCMRQIPRPLFWKRPILNSKLTTSGEQS